jgi:ribonuclease R
MDIKKLYQAIYDAYQNCVEIDDVAVIKLANTSEYLNVTGNKICLKKQFCIGTMDVKKDFGFLRQPEDDIYIDKKFLNGAMQDDFVLVDDTGYQSKVVHIISRAMTLLLCRCHQQKDTIYFEPLIEIQQLLQITFDVPLVQGHLVAVYIDEIDGLNIKGHVDHIVGHEHDPDIETKKIVSSYQWPQQFGQDVYQTLKKIEKETFQTIDFEDVLVITIDGADAKDLDDAIHLKKVSGGFEIGVHIADVSHYVKPNDAIDVHAFSKTTSVYLADRVIPMLPEYLSNDRCSLNPLEPKKTLSIIMKLNDVFEVVSHRFQSTVIMSNYRLTYDEVNAILHGNKKHKNPKLQDMLFQMNQISKGLSKIRHQRGEMNFHTEELKFHIENHAIINVSLRKQDEAEKLIESLMLLANETVAKHFNDHRIASLYRTHDVPDIGKLQKALHILTQLGVSIPHQTNQDAHYIQKIIKQTEQHPQKDLIHMILLRAMQKASYESQVSAHFGLGATYYTHFTSPIRRYPDLIIHRLIHMFILKDHPIEQLDLFNIAKHTSTQERIALSLERDVNQLKSCEFMVDKMNKIFSGTIIATLSRGMFVRLESGIEGFVSLKTMKQHVIYHENTVSYSDRRGLLYRLGDQIEVELIGVDIVKRHIDFRIMNQVKRRGHHGSHRTKQKGKI